MFINWNKCNGDQWCNLIKLNLDHPHFNNLEGVYIIWHGAPNPTVVRVGQGIIRDRLRTHREDPLILIYKEKDLYVTWAAVDFRYRDGIERYLAEKWHPKVGTKFPDVQPTQVNSPW